MRGWREVKLKDVSEYVTVGFVGSMAEHYVESGIPFLRSLNIQPFQLTFKDLMFIPESFHDSIKKSKLKPGDVAIVRTGYPGTACVIPDDLPDSNCSDLVILRPGPELNAHYVAAIFNSSFGQSLVGGNLVGAAQQHFNVTVAKELKLLLPPRKEQDKIAATLVALNDLIASTQRRIALLQSMAEELYREWFVRMRFPGAQNALVARRVPFGWREGILSELAVECGKPTSAGRHLEERFYCPLDALASKLMIPEAHHEWDQAQSSLVTFDKGEILFGAMRPYQHKVALAPFDGITRTTTFVLRPKQPEYFSYLFLTLFQSSSVDFATQICNGADRPYAVWNRGFERLPVWIPDVELAIRFNDAVQPILESLISSYFLVRSLAKQRDALLPRLISGKLRVDHLDIQYPPSMKVELAKVA